MKTKRVAILGAGNGGCAYAGNLALKGFEVALYEDPKFKKNIDDIREKGGVELTGAVQGLGKLSQASVDMKDVLPGADVVLVVAPAFAQMPMMESALPYLEDGQIVVFNPDNYGAIMFRQMLKKKGIKKAVKVAGTSSMIYLCRKQAPATVTVWGEKRHLPVAALPATDTGTVVESLKLLYPQFAPAKNVLVVDLNNSNMINHCPVVIMNAGRIEDEKGNFSFYGQGVTKSVDKVMMAMDEERVKVGTAMGVGLLPTTVTLAEFYPYEKPGKTIGDFLSHSKTHAGHGPDAPKELNMRFLSEDVPMGLVPVVSFARLAKVPTPVTDAIILLSSLVCGTDFVKEGRNLQTLGLSGLSPQKIVDMVDKGM